MRCRLGAVLGLFVLATLITFSLLSSSPREPRKTRPSPTITTTPKSKAALTLPQANVAHAATPRPKPKARVVPMEATAYCLRGKTATGTTVRRGVVAVDPKVIPLGTRVHVEGYGWARAEDTGHRIRGRRVDIWLPSRSGCYRWGRRTVRVTIPPKDQP